MKRATYHGESTAIIDGISIHALVKRATRRPFLQRRKTRYFNPRPREEGDPAPARGSAKPNDFNPRPREEGDPLVYPSTAEHCNFNPRPREEGDLFHCLYCTKPVYFNPRPREEGDMCNYLPSKCLIISIHALVKRATRHPF